MLPDGILQEICRFVHHNPNQNVDSLLEQLMDSISPSSFSEENQRNAYRSRAKNFVNKHATFDAGKDKVWKMDADFVYKFALPFSFVRGAKDVPASATKTDVDEEGVTTTTTTTTKRESRKASRRNYAEMMHPEEEEEEENKKKRRKKQKVMANKELSPVVEVPSKREMRHRRKKEQEEIEELMNS